MSLPLLEIPKYSMTLLNGATVSYRPFLVKEQKILLTALETGERKDALRAVRSIVSACTDNAEATGSNAPTFEIERLFLHIRAKSVGEEMPINVKCDGCGTPNPYTIKLLEDMQVSNNEPPKPVKITDTYTLVFAYPTMMDMEAIANVPTTDPTLFYTELAKRCLVGIGQGQDYVTAKDSTPAEIEEALTRLTPPQFNKVQEFFDNIPIVSYTIRFKCVKCSKDNELTVEGIDSFFG